MSLFYVGHPKETDLALFAGGELGPLARWRIEKHLESCEACQTDVADFFHLQGDLEELSELPTSVDWDAMALRIREAVAEAGEAETEPATGFFQKPLAWQLGLATTAVICGFIVVQQFPFPATQEQVMTASQEQDKVRSEAPALEAGEALGFSAASAPAATVNEAQIAAQKRESQALADLDSVAAAPREERAQQAVAEKKEFELAVRSEDSLPGDRMPAAAPPPAAEPLMEQNRAASDLRANKNAGFGTERDAADAFRGRAANAPAPTAPRRQVESRRKDDAEMTIAMADAVTGPAALREGFDQPAAEKEEVSADEMQLAKAEAAPAGRRVTVVGGQTAQVGASFAMQPGGLGTSITPAADGSEVVVDVKTDGGLRFRTVDAATGRITITDTYAQ